VKGLSFAPRVVKRYNQIGKTIGGILMSCAEILEQALALPENDRANLVHSLINSLPPSPRLFSSEQQLGDELARRIEETKSGVAPTFDAADTMRRAREAIKQVRP
jgi:putative addiction module component (TIGR02574 family)